jgi:hypothetical protein
VLLEGLGQLKKKNDFIGNRTHDIPACIIVHQPTICKARPVGIMISDWTAGVRFLQYSDSTWGLKCSYSIGSIG